jgi:hypothetical protein
MKRYWKQNVENRWTTPIKQHIRRPCLTKTLSLQRVVLHYRSVRRYLPKTCEQQKIDRFLLFIPFSQKYAAYMRTFLFNIGLQCVCKIVHFAHSCTQCKPRLRCKNGLQMSWLGLSKKERKNVTFENEATAVGKGPQV